MQFPASVFLCGVIKLDEVNIIAVLHFKQMSHTKFDSLHKAEKVGIIFVPTIILVVFNVE